MDLLNDATSFNHLSIEDLLDARDAFHVHLLRKKNVLATAVGRYRVRKSDPWPVGQATGASGKEKTPKTLASTEVRPYSWPCLLVFVEPWEAAEALFAAGQHDLVPSRIYLPDGRVVPVCVIEAVKAEAACDTVSSIKLNYPRNVISGGFPIVVVTQGVERIASVGCLVTDGHKVYAVTSRHVCGEAGTPVHTRIKGRLVRIGVSAGRAVGNLPFPEVYPGWGQPEQLVNCDCGLIEVDDLNQWKTEIAGIGPFGALADLNQHNISLNLINVKDNALVVAHGAVSGRVEGEIAALFYRYRSLGGLEYTADFLIAPKQGSAVNLRHGDSGTIWLLQTADGLRPIGLNWGSHEFEAGGNRRIACSLATSLSHVFARLEVELLRGWNLEQYYTWGKTGHFKIATLACQLVSNPRLRSLLAKNQRNIGYTDDELRSGNVVKMGSGEFVPLADVADLVWRSTRKADEVNHYADVDESNTAIAGGKTLLELCRDDANISVDAWNSYYAQFEAIDPKRDPNKRGALPFRVWQIYRRMVRSLSAGRVAEFICAGGIVSHYVADACIPLHVSCLHHGRDQSEYNVHSDYENGMIDRNMGALFAGVEELTRDTVAGPSLLGGKKAAWLVVDLMRTTLQTLPPLEIIEVFNAAHGRDKYQQMWLALGERTIANLAAGCRAMAALWESAWAEGKGENLKDADLIETPQAALQKLYLDRDFLPAYRLRDPRLKAALL